MGRDRRDTRRPWLGLLPHTWGWSLAGGKVTLLTCLATECPAQGYLQPQGPGHCGVLGLGERGEVLGDPD